MPTTFATDSAWQQVKFGAGGYVTGIDVHSDGTMVVRTDGAGAYRWDGNSWVQLVNIHTMPADTGVVYGVYEIRIAPSDSNIFYMEAAGGVYKSVDQGANWTKTNFPSVFMDANGEFRMDGQKMAIDPDDANVVYAGTQKDGLWVTRDGGVNWSQVSAIPTNGLGTDPGLTGIVIHDDTIYVGTSGHGVYRSTDDGVTWQRVPGGPVDVSYAAISDSGELYVTENTGSALWKFADGVWTILIENSVHAVAIDPFDPSHVVAITGGGTLQESQDSGASWSGWSWYSSLESSNDVTWLETSGNYMGVGGIVFDPLVPNRLIQSAGVGVWSTTIPDQLIWNEHITWNSMSQGIENVVPNDIIAPLGGNPVFASWDRAFVTMDDVDSYATSYSGGDFSMGWSLDYASTDPSFIVGISDWWGREHSGYSTDGGQTWHEFAGLPSWALNTIGGSIAASTTTNFIWASPNNVPPAYTLDGGHTWTNINIPGLTDWSGFHWAYYLKRTTIAADRVNDNTFYLYDTNSGVYVTQDGGVNWIKVFNGQISPFSGYNAKIEAVPGSEGELYFTSGNMSGDPTIPGEINLMHSTDGGASWQPIEGVQEVTAFGFGAPKVAGGPATIFIVGFVDGEYGVWYSTDESQNWTQVGRFPMGNLDEITVISGDMNDFGMVYIGLGGNGYMYLDIEDLDGAVDPATPTPPLTDQPSEPSQPDLPQVPEPEVNDDFNGDGLSDILVHSQNGVLSNLLATGNGAFIANDLQASAAVSSNWRVADTGGFNGDGRSDVLWRGLDGQVSNWLGDANGGFTPNNGNAASLVSVNWQVAGTGDFNGDGRDDVLWRNLDGQLSNWLGTSAGGFTPNNVNAATMVALAWKVVGTGDFNGDGRDDILWRNTDGTVSDWLGTASGGFTANDANAARWAPTAWHVVGTGDFNGDGRDDILWRNDNGQVSDWLGQANGGFIINDAVALTKTSTAWVVVGTGDYNGDGRDDILFRHNDGTMSNWFGTANGGFIANDDAATTNVASSWQVQAVDHWL